MAGVQMDSELIGFPCHQAASADRTGQSLILNAIVRSSEPSDFEDVSKDGFLFLELQINYVMRGLRISNLSCSV
jgi:hypothetical protein